MVQCMNDLKSSASDIVMSEQITISENAAPTASAIAAQVAETVSSAGTTGEGLSSENPSSDIDPRIVENTVLTNAATIVETTALTEYHDSQQTSVLDIPYDALPTLDENFTFAPGFFRVIERSVPLFNEILPQTTPAAWPWKRLDILNGLLGQDFIQNKLNYPVYVRFNLEVQIKVLATNFHYGQIMVVWRPAYCPFLKGCWRRDTVNPNDMCLNYPPGTWDPFGPYDSVFTASQLPHQVLPITAGTSATISLPWTLNYQYVRTQWMTEPNYHIGYLDIYLLTPILPTDIDSPRIQVFGRFKDIMGFGYRSVEALTANNSNAYIKRIRYITGDRPLYQKDPYVDATPYDVNLRMSLNTLDWKTMNVLPVNHNTVGETRVFKPWDVMAHAAGPTSVVKVKSPSKKKLADLRDRSRTPPKDKPSETIQAGHYKEEEAMSRGGALYQTWTKIVSTANSVASFIGSGLQALGLSKPPMPENPQRFFMVSPPLASSVAPDFTVSTSMDQVALCQSQPSDHPDTVMIANMAAIPTYVGYIQFGPQYKSKSQWFNITSAAWFDANYALATTPAGYIATNFQFWRANFKYRLHFSSSSFVNARFSVTVKFLDNNTPAPGIVPTQYVEVKGDIIVEGEVPYLHPAPWSTTYGNYVENMRVGLTITLLDDVVTWRADQQPPILCGIWISWPGLQVAGPLCPVELGIPWGFAHGIDPLPTRRKACFIAEEDMTREVLQSQELPGKTSTHPPLAYGMNDIPQSVYHLSKRYVEGRGSSFTPFAPYMALCGYARNASPNYLMTYQPINTKFAVLFRWVRGSANVVTDGTDFSIDDYAAPPENEGRFHHTMIGWHNFAKSEQEYFTEMTTRPYLKRVQGSIIAHRQPFRSNLPFVSGPHVIWTFSANDGIPAWANISVGSMSEQWRVEVLDTFLFHMKADQAVIPFSYAYGDDLCYNQWMGVPILIKLEKESLRDFLWGPTRPV